MLIPPGGAGAIRIATREPLRPLAHVIQALSRIGLGGRPAELVGTPRAIVTEEGEHAVLFALRSTGAGPVLERHIGLIFGDTHLALIDGRVGDAPEFARYAELVDRITRSWCMGLGGERWRRCFYQPPPGWAGLSRFQTDVWLAPGFPRHHAVISVFHARPERTTRPAQQHSRLFEHLTGEFRPLGSSMVSPIRAHSGLIGEIALFEAGAGDRLQHAANVGFTDGRYNYLVRVESDAAMLDTATSAFRAVYESIEPIPRPTADLSTLVHWAE